MPAKSRGRYAKLFETTYAIQEPPDGRFTVELVPLIVSVFLAAILDAPLAR